MNRTDFLGRHVVVRLCGSFIIALMMSCSSSARFSQSDHGVNKEFIKDSLHFPTSNETNDIRLELSRFALTFIGTPYCLGGTDKSCLDCSGFVQLVYRHIGISLPRTTSEMAAVGNSRRIQLRDARVGDVLFFDFDNAGAPTHVGVYLGSGTMIHASTSRGVVVDDALARPFAPSLQFILSLLGDEH